MKRVADLDIALVHYEQNIDIPEIHLVFPPFLIEAANKCRAAGHLLSSSELGWGDRISNDMKNKLMSLKKQWLDDIQRVTGHRREITQGTALREVNYWLALRNSLQSISQSLEAYEVQLLFHLLKSSNLIVSANTFDNASNLRPRLEEVSSNYEFLKEIPLNSLLTATDFPSLKTILTSLFSQLKRIKSARYYPIARLVNFVNCISSDLYKKCLSLLEKQRILSYSYNDFSILVNDITAVFKNWESESLVLWGELRELMSKRGEKGFVKFVSSFDLLKDRIRIIRDFREMHEKYLNSLQNVFSSKDSMAISNQFATAYEPFRNYMVADLSEANIQAWTLLSEEYNRHIEQMDQHIVSILRDKLSSVHSSDQMFVVFEKYNSLFFRPRIQISIQQYQSSLLDQCKRDVQTLKDMVSTISYPDSEAHQISVLYGIPELAGSFIWAKQIENRLHMIEKRVELLLGQYWEKHQEGRKIKEDVDVILNRVNTSGQFARWEDHVLAVVASDPLNNTIFSIQHSPDSGYAITVNCDDSFLSLFKEIRTFSWLGVRANVSIRVASEQSSLCYSRATAIRSALSVYSKILRQEELAVLELAAHYHQEVRDLISRAIKEKITWKTPSLTQFTRRFTTAVFTFQEKVKVISRHVQELNRLKLECSRCSYDYDSFLDVIKQIQGVIDDLNNLRCFNMEWYCNTVDQSIAQVLVQRCDQAVLSWVIGFKRKLREEIADHLQEEELIAEESEKISELSVYNGVLQTNCVHLIRVSNHNLVVHPPVADTKKRWIDSLLSVIGTVTSLPRIRLMPDVYAPKETGENATYLSIAMEIKQEPVKEGLIMIEDLIKEVNGFVGTWLKNQAIWRLNPKTISEQLNADVNKWQQLLRGVVIARKELDMENTERCIGCVHINLEQIQSSISVRYESLHKDLLNTFGSIILSSSQQFVAQLKEARNLLEKLTVSGATHEAINLILVSRDVSTNLPLWKTQKESLLSCQYLLEEQGFAFPSEWVYSQQIENDWGGLEQILTRRLDSIKSSQEQLKKNVIAEDNKVQKAIDALLLQWEASKPQEGSVPVDEALQILKEFEGKLAALNDKRMKVNKGRDALSLDVHLDNPLDLVLTEVNGLTEAWSSVQVYWKRLGSLGDTLWSVFVPKTLNQEYNALEHDLETVPSRVKQYSCYIYLQNTLRSYKRDFKLLQELKNSALKDRHWSAILSILHISSSLEFLHVRDFWIPAFNDEKEKILEVLSNAQGELGIEDFLKQIRDTWSSYQLELVSYQQRCKLIRGWELLFSKLDEHVSALSSMKQSPYYKVFSEEASNWEDKVIRMRVLFDTWIDVQRRWVYLEGIFMSGAEIIQQLPQDYNRFKTIDADFVSMMRKVSAQPRVLDVFNTPNIQRTLERLSQQLTKIQKSLGEFLDKQRQAFSRFYFVGDEDLLEIIGNSNDPLKVQRHLNKMFAGISSIEFESNGTDYKLTAMVSKEGEVVPLVTPILITPESSVVAWLTKVEEVMRETLAVALQSSLSSLLQMDIQSPSFVEWLHQYPSQIIILSIQIFWCSQVERALHSTNCTELLKQVAYQIDGLLKILAERVLHPLHNDERKKVEQCITEFVYEKSTTQSLIEEGVKEASDFKWQYRLRAYYDENEHDLLKRLRVCIADATFFYGYEYLGVCERLVQTPLTDRCYLTLSQALCMGLGGNPFGPAGTGKTESVKMLASLLGRFCLVFNCDESFDFQAMGRIFCGLCQVGAWGCFDEFNRLEERILSAVSQQIWTIQTGLRDQKKQITLLDKSVNLHPNVGIFVTMNPGYAGRSNLPDNLKQLFRGIAMIQPDWEKIAQVMLFSQGFSASEVLAGKMVLLFTLCQDQLSSQAHYDFGLRALKSVVVSAGNLKRSKLEQNEKELLSMNEKQQEEFERDVLLSSVCDTLVPKLVAEDLPLLQSLLSGVFTGATIKQIEATELRSMMKQVCKEHKLCATDAFVEKALQLYLVQDIRHGIMLVGPSGSGKSSVIQCLIEAMERVDGQQGVLYTIDPKAISKEQLFGSLDNTTNEWTDGIFTHIIRQIYNDVRGESNRRHWIVFDGDVDPEWAENLNSVLDDNKLLTLPTGDRLSLPSNVRILFEVENLKYATPASVSRCGTVWFSEETVRICDILAHSLMRLRTIPLVKDIDSARILALQNAVADILVPYYDPHCLIEQCVTWSLQHTHIMEVTIPQLIGSFDCLIQQLVIDIIEYNMEHMDYPMKDDHLLLFVSNRMIEAAVWGIGGSLMGTDRLEFCEMIRSATSMTLPSQESLIDYCVSIRDGSWRLWKDQVPQIDIDPKRVLDTSIVIPTVDTVRNQHLMKSFLTTRKPVILCGPPGSGKTMTLTDSLKTMNGYDVVSVNFSSTTQPSLVMKIFEQYGVYDKTPNGLVLHPAVPDKWLVIFCDEVNLPEEDKYGTQRVISFLRQLVEQQGFWNTKEHLWVHIENIQFVAACNPPTDPGRVPLSTRFLSHAPVLFVDYPEQQSLFQIYSTFNKALVTRMPSISHCYEQLTEAMVSFYEQNKLHFSLDQQPQYVYSPRELSRWMRALYNAFTTTTDITVPDLVRLTAHEALRLFCDRLVTHEEKVWCQQTLKDVLMSVFKDVSPDVLKGPILFSPWLNGYYESVDQDRLRRFLEKKLHDFNDEELNVPLVLFDDVLEHVVRIDRVLRQSLGHLLLVGESGAGKTVLTRFVAWMDQMNVFQIKITRRYSLEDFDEDLRSVMRQAGVEGQQTCFIFDESNILSTGFLERMNALLASGEVPGLYEGDDMISLMSACRDASRQEGLVMDSYEEMFKWFTSRVQRNLHVVFTMNPANGEFRDRAATSPALFNRCVVDWFGSWDRDALLQVSNYFTRNLVIDIADYVPSNDAIRVVCNSMGLNDLPSGTQVTLHDAVNAAILSIHQGVVSLDEEKTNDTHCYCSPRDYLDFINHYLSLFQRKHEELEGQQRHLCIGLERLHETEEQVRILREQVSQKKEELDTANIAAQEKLKQIVEKKELATKNQEISMRLAEELKTKYGEIAEKRMRVNKELDQVEPLLLEAKNSVKQINKAQLNEIRTMVKPPINVQYTIQAVCCLLGEECSSWKDIQKAIRKEDFISSIVNFNTSRITRKSSEEASTIMHKPDFTYEAANRSSKACGPLYKWVKSQLEYSHIIQRVKPLSDEMTFLTQKSEELRKQHDECLVNLKNLNDEIEGYSKEYGMLTQRCQQISEDIHVVTQKSIRSVNLLESLESEQKRWKDSSNEFMKELSSMIGDCLLGASFMTYAGFFDQHHRSFLLEQWKELLFTLCIPFNPHFDATGYLSNSKDRLVWQSNGLPSDELCVQNAIILNRFNRYPLLIDPSGQGTSYLMNVYSSNRIVKTSFLDKSFMKHLESALRFGSVLIIQDVENADPVLNPLLNKEFHKEDGRLLIRLGDQEINFSPSFKLFLTTRDSSYQFPPDLCSRVTFVNFTMTISSLQDQCMSIILQKEAPMLYQKRNDLLQLQGEYQARLRDLEEQLLISLNTLQGNILDNDTVMNNLEQLKTEAKTISQEINQANDIMNSIRESSCIYQPLSQACSQIYFILDSLHHVFFLYRFNLHFFLDILHSVLQSSLPSSLTPSQRMSCLLQLLYRSVYARVSRGLKHLDSRILALRLCQLYVQNTANQPDEDEFQLLLKGSLVNIDDSAEKFVTAIFADTLTEEQENQVMMHLSLEKTTNLKKLLLHRSAYWTNEFTEQSIEELAELIDILGENGWSRGKCMWRWLLLIKELRPELLISAIEYVVSELCDKDFFSGEVYDLRQIIKEESKCDAPLLLCSAPGYDASKKIEAIYLNNDLQLDTVAMGNTESYGEAEKLISVASSKGTAVLLRNVHLCPEWLNTLEKQFFTLHPHPDFRLYMTSEISEKLPPSLLRLCYTLVFETPTGIRASLKHSLNVIPEEVMNAKPVERCRVYFLLLWLHAVVEERLRYVPVGWTKSYEFSEADLKCSLTVIDRWIQTVSRGLSHMDPEAFNWKAVRTLLSQSLYGGRVDNPFDDELLRTLIDRLFIPQCFDSQFPLVQYSLPSGEIRTILVAPEGTCKQDFEKWVDSLPVYNPPDWLGLQATAEKRLLSSQGRYILRSLLLIQDSIDIDRMTSDLSKVEGASSSWMTSLAVSVEHWLSLLLIKIQPLTPSKKNLQNPLFRFFSREVHQMIQLQKMVVEDLKFILGVCQGKLKSTHQIRILMKLLSQDRIPESWDNYYKSPQNQICSLWMQDLIIRCQHFTGLTTLSVDQLRTAGVWLGGLFHPEAYITAMRQTVAQENNWSLDKLRLKLRPLSPEEFEQKDMILNEHRNAFLIHALILEGAEWIENQLVPSDLIRNSLDEVLFEWESESEPMENVSKVPIYLNEGRSDLLYVVEMKHINTIPSELWSQRAVSIIAWRQG